MSLYTVAKRITGVVPATPLTLAQTSVSQALGTIYDTTDWSYQKGTSGWLAPGMVFNTGTFTTTPYSNQVIADAAVTGMLLAYTGQPLITQLQYRNPGYSVYNIIAYDNGQTSGQGNFPFATLTLDRPWGEPTTGPGQPYMIYQVYFPGPVQDFRKFVSIEDPTNFQYMDFWSMTQAQLAQVDPQRTNFSIPSFVVPAGIDQRPGSATLGWQMFELWPHQGSYVPYTFNFRRRGPIPQSASDFLTMSPPYPISEELVEWRAREVLCQFKEAQKEKPQARGVGTNWLMLAQMAQKEYATLLGQAISIDLNLDGEAFTQTRRRGRWDRGPAYASFNGGLNLGGYPDSN